MRHGPKVACDKCEDGAEVWCPDYDETLCDDCQSSTCQCDGTDA